MPFPLETWTWPANCGANSHPSVLQQNPLQRWIMMSQITVLHASSSRHVRGLFRGIHLNCLHASQFPSHLSIPEGLWRKAERTPDNISPDCTGALEMSSLQPASRSEMVSGFEEEIRSLMALFSRERCNYARQWMRAQLLEMGSRERRNHSNRHNSFKDMRKSTQRASDLCHAAFLRWKPAPSPTCHAKPHEKIDGAIKVANKVHVRLSSVKSVVNKMKRNRGQSWTAAFP